MMRGKKGSNKRGIPRIFLKNSRGQVTIFIIIAVLIIALGVLVYMFYPKIFSGAETETKNPSAFIQECMEEKIQDTVEIVSLQGGSVNPTFYYDYYDNDENKLYIVEYLCYTNQYYQLCIVQQPMLIQQLQSEIEKEIQSDSEACFNSMKKSYENKGYGVDLEKGVTEVRIEPGKIIVDYNGKLILTKGEVQVYQNFEMEMNSNLYKMLNIATGIIYWETTQGDAPTDTFMDLYDLKIEKQPQIDGTKVYIISEFGDGKDKFQFASRSLVRPQGIEL